MDDYEQICTLGVAAIGTVVKGRHGATGDAVAMKLLNSKAVGGGPATLQWEALFLKVCASNLHVIDSRALAHDPATMEIFLVMEYDDESLHDVLHQHDRTNGLPLTKDVVCTAMWQMLSSARRMHDDNIIHHDIKPGNILIGDDLILRFCDFGLTVDMAVERPPYTPAGTLSYMAPEMLLEKPNYDALIDIWSLGYVMGEVITGRAPFQVKAGFVDQLHDVVYVLGRLDDKACPWFSSMPLAQLEKHRSKCSLLRCKYPRKKQSEEGFEVLKGLHTCNPDKRLTASAALKCPWFSKVAMLDLLEKFSSNVL